VGRWDTDKNTDKFERLAVAETTLEPPSVTWSPADADERRQQRNTGGLAEPVRALVDRTTRRAGALARGRVSHRPILAASVAAQSSCRSAPGWLRRLHDTFNQLSHRADRAGAQSGRRGGRPLPRGQSPWITMTRGGTWTGGTSGSFGFCEIRACRNSRCEFAW
jgi:hypothetical protein